MPSEDFEVSQSPLDLSNDESTPHPAPISAVGGIGGAAKPRRPPLACTICTEDISDQNQQIHYGATACFSCRAFFRRAQGLKRPFHPCKSGGKCVLTIDTRRFCGTCRYNTCLRSGMNPKAVLSEEQKKHRFRKMIKKRKEGMHRMAQEMGMVRSPSSHYSGSSDGSSSPVASPAPALSHTMSPDLSFAEQTFLDIHSSHQIPSSFNKSFLGDLYALAQRQLSDFASTLPDFNALSYLERQILLLQNGPSFAQFLICCYFAAPTGYDQFRLLFPHLHRRAEKTFRFVHVGDVVKSTLSGLFGEGSLVLGCYVEELSKTVAILQSDPTLSLSLAKKAILFQPVGVDSAGMSPAQMADPSKLVASRMKDLASMAKILLSLQRPETISQESSNISFLNFWEVTLKRVKSTTHHLIQGNQELVDNIGVLYQTRLPAVLSLYLVRLSCAGSWTEQMKMLEVEAPSGGDNRQEKIQVFRTSTNKYVMKRALEDFEALLVRYKRCFLNQEAFKLMVLLSIFWNGGDSNDNDSPSSKGGLNAVECHKGAQLTLLANLIKNTPSLGHTLYEEICFCLNELDALKYFCLTFASENVYAQL